MSHITACASKIALNRKDWILSAIRLMEREYPGIRVEEINGVILIRYSPIEVYQTKGNMRFIPRENGIGYELHLDHWNCQEIVNKVKDSFFISYQRAGALAYCQKNGYSAGSPVKTQTGQKFTATKW